MGSFENMDIPIEAHVLRIIKTLEESGFEAYAVGGARPKKTFADGKAGPDCGE